MPRYKLIVAYDGTRFHGFQRQLTNQDVSAAAAAAAASSTSNNRKNKNNDRPTKRPHWLASGQKKPCSQTIQQVLEDAILSWTETSAVEDLHLLFAGRTDKGVHSRGQVVVVSLPDTQLLQPHEIVNSINSRLPWDISVESAERCCPESFDPRRNVRLKQYTYAIKYRRKIGFVDSDDHKMSICKLGPHSFRSALDSPCLWHVPWALEDARLQKLCEFLQGHHDFAAFVHKEDRHAKCQQLTLDKMVFETLQESTTTSTSDTGPAAAVVVTGRFVLESKGFRRSMVRNLVGFCVDVCRGHDDLHDWNWNELWTSPDDAGKKVNAAPASGLCLEFVKYEEKSV